MEPIKRYRLTKEEHNLILRNRATAHSKLIRLSQKKYPPNLDKIKIRVEARRKEEKEKRLVKLTPCFKCGYKDLRAICLHHINKKKYPDLVVSLCANCHTIYHKLIGNVGTTETVAEVFGKFDF